MSRHNYIAGGSKPNLVTTRQPIYLVPTGRLNVNPYHWKNGEITILRGWPFNGIDLLADIILHPTQGIPEESQEQEQEESIVSDAVKAYLDWYEKWR